MYSHVACDVMKERTLYLLKPSSLIWHLMPYLFLFKVEPNVSIRSSHDTFTTCRHKEQFTKNAKSKIGETIFYKVARQTLNEDVKRTVARVSELTNSATTKETMPANVNQHAKLQRLVRNFRRMKYHRRPWQLTAKALIRLRGRAG